MWNTKIREINDIYRDPAAFWQGVKTLMGGSGDKIMYFPDNNGRKIYKTEEKEETFRHIWSNVFRITDEENQLFCRENERRINWYLQLHDSEINQF